MKSFLRNLYVFISLLFVVSLTISAYATTDILVATGSSWKYLDNGSNQGTAWKNATFNDASWATSNAEFGYGDGDETTIISYGGNANNKYITTYFRKSFNVVNPALYGSMLLSILRDDGAVVYINGTEVHRTNMPAGNIGFKTRASTEISGTAESTYYTATLVASFLTPGNNVIAVEIHQYVKTGPDISFNLQLTADAVGCGSPAGLNTTSISSTGAVLNWNAMAGAISYDLQYKPTTSSTWSIQSTTSTFITLTSLANTTDFEWQVRAVCSSATGSYTSSSLFTTLPASTIQTLISAGASWKYNDKGLDLGNSWRGVAYDESTWLTGNAELGYGDGDETTVVGYGTDPNNKYTTTYFRKAFIVANPSEFITMTLGLVRDDGAVVYINGTEVYRNNMPSGTVLYNTLASSAVADESTWYNSTFSSSLLVAGTNEVAVEIHQTNITSSDISFNFKLSGNTIPTVTRGAYLQSATPSSMIVRWRTDVATASRVRCGTSPGSYTMTFYNSSPVTEHTMPLTGLSPSTKYYYTVESGTTVLQADTGNYFRTNPVVGTVEPVRIWAIGDFGNAVQGQYDVRDAYKNYTGSTYTNLWIWLGDNAYANGTDAEYQAKVFDVYPQQFKKIPLYAAIGNHDYANAGYQSSSTLGTNFPYFSIMNNPAAAEAGGVASGTEKYYSYNYANIHFVSLDTYGAYNNPGSAMYNWLVNDLNANTQRWTIIYFHHPPYSKGSHNSDSDGQLTNVRQNLNPVFESHHVDLVLSGHSHVNERSYLIKGHFGLASSFNNTMIVQGGSGALPNPYIKTSPFDGTIYAVCGTSGQLSGTMQADAPMPCMYFTDNSKNASLVIDVNGDQLDCKYLSAAGAIIDQFTIMKSGTRPEVINKAEAGTNEFTIFPNPAHDNLTIQLTGELKGNGSVSIYNAIGEKVFSEVLNSNVQVLNFKIPAGAYFVKVNNDDKTFVRELIIE
jgi:hypothetical protein